MNGMHLKRVPI